MGLWDTANSVALPLSVEVSQVDQALRFVVTQPLDVVVVIVLLIGLLFIAWRRLGLLE